MTSERVTHGYEFRCDACGEVWKPPRLGIGSDTPDWHECWDACKAAGWRAVKIRSRTGKDEWEHRCKECV